MPRTRHPKSEHLQAVELFHVGMGVDVPAKPVVPSDERLLARAKLLMEEAMEFVEAAGIRLAVTVKPASAMLAEKYHSLQQVNFEDLTFEKMKPGDLVGMADGLADTMVICAGGMAICGIADLPLLREVNDNNLLKLATGHFDAERGKFIKAPNHPKPDIAKVLKAQGWEHEDLYVSRECN